MPRTLRSREQLEELIEVHRDEIERTINALARLNAAIYQTCMTHPMDHTRLGQLEAERDREADTHLRVVNEWRSLRYELGEVLRRLLRNSTQ